MIVIFSEEPIAEDSLWGEYDEAASAQSFLEAVKAWRGDEATPNSSSKSIFPSYFDAFSI